MEEQQIIHLVEKNYDIKVYDYNKIKGVYKIFSDGIDYALKVVSYKFGHFNFIINAILHLKKSGLKFIPEIILTKDDKAYFECNNEYYYISKWISSRSSNYNDESELLKVVQNVAILHKFSEGFKVTKDMEPRIYWFNWLKNFYIRKNEIINFRDRIMQKANKDEFDLIYFNEVDKEIETAEKSILALYRSKYFEIMKKQVQKRGFCHHDLAEHNVLISQKNNIYFIDFDYCILDSYLHVLASIIIRSNKDGRWSEEKFNKIIKSYSYIQKITEAEKEIILAFIRFPQEFWQLGIQKYWEMQDYSEDIYLKKLINYLEDRDKKASVISYLSIR